MSIIHQTNARVWLAVATVRLCRDGGTMAELRDALNARQRQRVPMPASLANALSAETTRQLRAWGRVEEPEALTHLLK